MLENRFEVVTVNEQEIKELSRLYNMYNFMSVYVTPDLVNLAAVMRSHINGKFKIYAMVDYPKGIKKGINKFHGTSTDFFMSDGYDITISGFTNQSDIWNEIQILKKFIHDMVNPVASICFTVNRHAMSNDFLMECAKALHKHPADRIKMESLTRLQPTKANFKTHSEALDIVRQHCRVPISLCGNINKKIYNEIDDCFLAISPQQLIDILDSVRSQMNKPL